MENDLQPQPQPPQKKGSVWMIVVTVLVIILLVLVGLFLWHRAHHKVRFPMRNQTSRTTSTGEMAGTSTVGSTGTPSSSPSLGSVDPSGASNTLAVGSHDYSVESNGLERTYKVYVPEGLPTDKPLPLVVMLHGGGGSSEVAEEFYGWDQQADKDKFVVAYPQGTATGKVHTWNVEGGHCCGQAAAENIDDVQFMDDMVHKIETEENIDKNRVYVSGMSNGAMMTYTLACNSDTFAAIGSVSGNMLNNCTTPRKISVMEIHGLQDVNVPFDGSRGTGVEKIDGPPIPDVIAFWQNVNQCSAPTTTKSDDGIVTTTVSNCPEGRSVELITVADANHTWPGAAQRGGQPHSMAIDSTDTLWNFFISHPKA